MVRLIRVELSTERAIRSSFHKNMPVYKCIKGSLFRLSIVNRYLRLEVYKVLPKEVQNPKVGYSGQTTTD